MPDTYHETGVGRSSQQAFAPVCMSIRLAWPVAAVLLLAGCGGGSPLDTPVSWFHDLEGGEIAAQRPPPPGAGMPYPKLVTVPAKPTVPNAAYRTSLQEQLFAERDRTERVAAHSPIEATQPPTPGKTVAAKPPAGTPGPAGGVEANAPAATGGAAPAIQASLPTADAPPAAPAAAPPAAPADAPVFLVGTPIDDAGSAAIPVAPPAPATFEGLPAEPAPTPPPPTPPHLPAALRGTDILFLPGEAVLRQSQMSTLRQIVIDSHGKRLDITGLGEAVSDTPDGQAAAIDLGLKRAKAVADGFASLHVPPASIRLASYAFGRGAEVKIVP